MHGNDKITRTDHQACTDVQLLLAEYCTGELERQEAASVAAHLRECPACREELAREERLRETLGSLPVQPCPGKLTAALLEIPPAAARRSGPLPAGRRISFRWPAGIGMAAAAAAVTLLLFSHPVPDQPETGEQMAPVPTYTEAEIADARRDLAFGLLLATSRIDQAERSTVKEIFGRTLPGSFTRSFRTLAIINEGGRG